MFDNQLHQLHQLHQHPKRQQPQPRKSTETPRLAQIPPAETHIPVKTHPDEEVQIQITILGMNTPEAIRQDREWTKYNERRRPGDGMTWRAWVWFSKTKGKYTMCGSTKGEDKANTNYNIKAARIGNEFFIDEEEMCPEDRESDFRGPGESERKYKL